MSNFKFNTYIYTFIQAIKAFYGAELLLSFSSMGTYKSNDVSVCVCLCVCICVLVSECVSLLVDCIARKKPINA